MKKNKKQKAEEEDVSKDVSIFGRNLARKSEDEPGSSLWLITFTDIMALMLTFFVLLYSMSVPQEEKWEELSDSVNQGLSKFSSPANFAGPQDTISIDKIALNQGLNLDYLQTILKEKIEDKEELANIVLIRQTDRLIVSLPQDVLFEAGETSMGIKGKRALFILGGILERIRNRIEVIGHADPRPVSEENKNYASNWELSLARAVEVSAVLREVGYRRELTVRGISSARYDELPDTIDQQRRYDLSRRVDIVIMDDDGSRRVFTDFGGSG